MKMSILKSEDGNELLVKCKCGCSGLLITKDVDDDYESYSIITSMGIKYYEEQLGAFKRLKEKLRRIWSIIRNKDYCYSEVILTRKDYETFKEYVNQF